MSETNDSETHALRESLDAINYEENPFVIPWGDNKYIMAVIASEKNTDPNVTKSQLITSAQSVYDTILDLDNKIKLSLTLALDYIEASPHKHFSPFDEQSHEMYLAWYFVENAVFRTLSVWDALAHLANIWIQMDDFQPGFGQRNINSYKFFNNPKDGYKDIGFFVKVKEYLNQEDNTESEPWFGNHQHVRNFRNSLAHRNTPTVTAMNIRTTADMGNFDSPLLNLRSPIMFDLYRIIGDYTAASNFVSELVHLMPNTI